MMTQSKESTVNDDVEAFIREYPNRQQVEMMTAWLTAHEPGTFTFTGLVDPHDTTVVTPQATVDYGYCWFSLSKGPAIVATPNYDKFFSVSVFDMMHNVPAVLVSPSRPIVLVRPGQDVPSGDYEVVTMETDQGLVFTRMVVVDNLDEVRALSGRIVLEGGQGDMHREVRQFSSSTARAGLETIKAAIPTINPDVAFGNKSGDVQPLNLAGAVMQGHLGTPSNTVRYSIFFTDNQGKPLAGDDTYEVTVPANIVHDEGYFSITVYGTDNKMLIPNDRGVYDRTTYTADRETDGTYTVTLSPTGDGKNGIPTGKPFYGLLRAYVPVQGADLTPNVTQL